MLIIKLSEPPLVIIPYIFSFDIKLAVIIKTYASIFASSLNASKCKGLWYIYLAAKSLAF